MRWGDMLGVGCHCHRQTTTKYVGPHRIRFCRWHAPEWLTAPEIPRERVELPGVNVPGRAGDSVRSRDMVGVE